MGVETLKQQFRAQAQAAAGLDIAYIGIVNGLFSALHALGDASPEILAQHCGVDPGYVRRWCDAGYAFGYLDEAGAGFRLTEAGAAMRPEAPETVMPVVIQAMLAAHMSERAAGLMKTGARPGEQVLAERETILPWFGAMLEASFGPLFESTICPGVPAFQEVDARGGLAVDLGCGNGWYLRALAQRCPHLRGLGLDGFEENVTQARRLAKAAGLEERIGFASGDIMDFTLEEPADLIAMNRALHHVWDRREAVFGILRDHLKPGGVAVMWEPNWPAERSALREPARRGLAFQNLSEHVQGNHLLRPDEIVAAFAAVDMPAETYLFAAGNEAVVVGRRL